MRAAALIWTLGIAGCGASAGLTEQPTPTSVATNTEPAQTFVSADGIHFVPGNPARHASVTLTAVAGWTKRTVAAPGELDVPNRALTERVRLAGVYGSGVLQPDRRSVVVEYRSGGCHDLARSQVSISDGKIRVSVFDGMMPMEDDEEIGCPGIAYSGHTRVRLPEAVPADTPVVVCDRKWPPCE